MLGARRFLSLKTHENSPVSQDEEILMQEYGHKMEEKLRQQTIIFWSPLIVKSARLMRIKEYSGTRTLRGNCFTVHIQKQFFVFTSSKNV